VCRAGDHGARVRVLDAHAHDQLPARAAERSAAGDAGEAKRALTPAAHALQLALGIYTKADAATLNAALDGFPLSELRVVCCDRVDALRAIAGATRAAAETTQDVRSQQVGFLVLAYACCVNHVKWFVRCEALLARSKVDRLAPADKIEVLRLLNVEVEPMHAVLKELEALVVQARTRPLGACAVERGNTLQGMVKGFAEHVLRKPLVEVTATEWQEFHAVPFEHATSLLGSRQVALHGGLAYVQDWQLVVVIRQAYEERLTAFAEACRLRLGTIAQINTSYYTPQFATVLCVMHDVQLRVSGGSARQIDSASAASGAQCGLSSTAQTLSMAVARFAPLCIVRLVLKLQATGHLVDKERVTLRLWLRATGVSLDVAVEFWQARVEDGEDARRALALVYAKQYACVGCSKIKATGLCPFQDSDKSVVSWCAETAPALERDMEDIVAATPCPSQRCGRVFALRHGQQTRSHGNPAAYFRAAAGLV